MMTSKDARMQSIKSRKDADLGYNKLHATYMLDNPDYIEIYTLLEDEIKMACRLGLHDVVISQARLNNSMLGLALEVIRHNGFVFFANEFNLRISWAA